ncbi:MAG TPA: archease [Anaerolineales bacterium]|nr:archease [Anaerolineales bacterium]
MDVEKGFEELEHTADWALRIWAPDMTALLVQAAEGMNYLAEIKLARKRANLCDLSIDATDREMLLVNFLNEILYCGEVEHVGFDHFELQLDGLNLTATLFGAKIVSQKKEIKAVTYHNLAVQETERGLEVEIVFDV